MSKPTKNKPKSVDISNIVIWYDNKVLIANIDTLDFDEDQSYDVIDFDTKSIYKGKPVFTDEPDRIFAQDQELIEFKPIKD